MNQVLDEKKRRRWVQDSDKRKVQISKENFYPVLPGRSRKEVAAQWFKELAGYKSLSTLSKKVIHITCMSIVKISLWSNMATTIVASLKF